MLSPKRLLAASALVVGGIAAVAIPGAGASASSWSGPLTGAQFSLQNYFNSAGELTPFFDQIDGHVGRGFEIKGDYIYDINFKDSSIVMRWNTAPDWDAFEPYVGAISGSTQEEAAAAPIADEYHITFDTDISGLRFDVTSKSTLQPNTRVEGDHTLVISIPGGTDIGDGFDARIKVRYPVNNVGGLDYSLQNYFNTGDGLIPFFDQLDGTVGRGVEIDDGYIYDINLSRYRIDMTWNTDPEWDAFEPYVGAISGSTQEEAAAAPIADEYHFTFEEKVSHLTPIVDPWQGIEPEVRFEDDYTVVIAIPGGTAIGDGIGLRVWLWPWAD